MPSCRDHHLAQEINKCRRRKKKMTKIIILTHNLRLMAHNLLILTSQKSNHISPHRPSSPLSDTILIPSDVQRYGTGRPQDRFLSRRFSSNYTLLRTLLQGSKVRPFWFAGAYPKHMRNRSDLYPCKTCSSLAALGFISTTDRPPWHACTTSDWECACTGRSAVAPCRN